MGFEIKLIRKADIIVGISEMIITWKKGKSSSFLTVECGKEKYDVKTEGDIEKKIIDLSKSIIIHPFVKNKDDYLVLDGTDYTYSIEELHKIDLTRVSLPKVWFFDWLKQLEKRGKAGQ